MSFTLPDLPYPYDALAPFMSRETLEYHHDKHHLAYVVNTGNNLLKGTEWEGKLVEEVMKGSFGKNQALFNNAGQHYNHIHFWKWMKPNGGGDKIPGNLEKKIIADLGSIAKMKEDFVQAGVTQFGSGWFGSQCRTARSSWRSRRTARIRSCMAARPSSAATSGSTPTISRTPINMDAWGTPEAYAELMKLALQAHWRARGYRPRRGLAGVRLLGLHQRHLPLCRWRHDFVSRFRDRRLSSILKAE